MCEGAIIRAVHLSTVSNAILPSVSFARLYTTQFLIFILQYRKQTKRHIMDRCIYEQQSSGKAARLQSKEEKTILEDFEDFAQEDPDGKLQC